MARVRADARAALNGPAGELTRPGAGGALLRELSIYQGISEAIINAVRHAAALDWARLRESRF